MAHLIETMTRASNTAESWHAQENVIPHDAPFDDWFAASGLNYDVHRAAVEYVTDNGEFCKMDNKHVLYRSDTHAPLAVVGEDYKIVQPYTVLEFFRNLCDENKLVMDTAGVLAGGKRVWALARTKMTTTIGTNDVIKQYILLATSYDTTMATIAKPTTVRVVCNNTLSQAYGNGEAVIKINHNADFDAERVQLDMGLIEAGLSNFGTYAADMLTYEVTPTQAARWYAELLKEREVSDEEFGDLMSNRVLRQLMNSYTSAPGATPTLWGLVNGTTHTVDHVRGRGYDTRMNSAWFGQGDLLKRKAWDKAAQFINAARETSRLLTAVS